MIKLFVHLKPYFKWILGIFAVTFIYAVIYLCLPKYMGDIVDYGVAAKKTAYIYNTGRIMIILALLGVVFSSASIFLSVKVSSMFGRDIREKLYTKIVNLSLGELNGMQTSSLITRTINDVNQVQQVLSSILRVAVFAPMLCIGGAIMIDKKAASIQWILWTAILGLAAYTVVVLRRLFPLYEKLQIMIDKLNSVLREGLVGVRVIRAFNRTDFQRKKYEDVSYKLTDIGFKVNCIDASIIPVVAIVVSFTTLAIIWFGGIAIDRGNMQIGSMLTFMQYAMQIIGSIVIVASTFVEIPRAIASANRINEVLDLEQIIADPTNPVEPSEKRGIVEFKNVSYKYKGADEAAIEDISFIAEPGKMTAIIGGTGSGKSTILNLIERFYDVTDGSITVDGVDVRKMSQECLRDKISLVPQNQTLFTGTISENIKYGKKDASGIEVEHAAAVAQAAEFIGSSSSGFDSEISKGGVNISGGQKQRLSLARALLKNAEIYLFDDSFSALDLKTESMLRSELKKELSDKTVIIVSQRVSSIIGADKIIVIDDGKVAGAGKHNELLKHCSVYREIVFSQFLEEETV
jgi:ATP-binding cassette subfamily B protein